MSRIIALLVSLSFYGSVYAGEVPSPPCAGCGGTPSKPQPLFVFPPKPLINPPVPNALEYDGANLWFTNPSGVRGTISNGSFPSTINTTMTFGSSGVLDLLSGSVVNFADGSVWSDTGLIYGTGTNLSFPDGSAWDSSGLIFGTSGTETLPDGSKWTSSGLTIPSGKTITNNGTISGGTLSGNTIAGAYTFSPNSVTGPVPGQLIILSTVASGYIQLNIPNWANNIDIQLTGSGGGGASSTYVGGGGGYARYIGPIINLKNGTSSNVICYDVGGGGEYISTGSIAGGGSALYTGSSCTGTLSETLLANGGNAATPSANGAQGTYSTSLSSSSGNIIYGNNNQAGCNSQQPAYTYSSAFCVGSSSIFGVGGNVSSNGIQGVILVKFYP